MGTKVDPTNLSGKHLRLSRTIIIIFTIIVMLMTLGIIGLICVLLFAYNIDELSEIINSQVKIKQIYLTVTIEKFKQRKALKTLKLNSILK